MHSPELHALRADVVLDHGGAIEEDREVVERAVGGNFIRVVDLYEVVTDILGGGGVGRMEG